MRKLLVRVLLTGTALAPLTSVSAVAQAPTQPPVGFANSTSISPGTVIPNLLDSYTSLVTTNPSMLIQNYNDVVAMTQARTDAQTLAAVHDDRTSQQYSVMNGLGALTSLFLTGAGASASGAAPQSLTPTVYAPATLANYQANINYLTNASAGTASFGDGTATPLANAVDFVNNVVRANSSTEPPKRTFERAMIAGSTLSPLDPIFANYAVTSPNGLGPAQTANIVVPSYLSSYATPTPYATTAQWVRGFTVTQAMVDANGGQPITAPNLGTFQNGVLAPTQFGVGSYVPGIGAAPRPYRVSTAVNVPSLLYQVINSTNPYADGAFPSGHTNSAYTQALGVSFLVPQQLQELLTRASDLGNNRVLAGMHSPLDVIGGRIEATAIAATNLYGALYDASGNRLDWTNPANASAYAAYQAYTSTQSYLAGACGASSVSACIAQAKAAGFGDAYSNPAQNKADYTARLSYGFAPTGATSAMTDAQVPVQAQALLLTRLPYLTDAQRTDVLATTALPNGYPLLSGNTWDGWGQLNLVAAADGYGRFNQNVAVTMDALQGGYNAADSWNNDIGGSGKLTKQGTGELTLTGANSFTGGTEVDGGRLVAASRTALGTGDATIGTGGTLAITASTTVGGNLLQRAGGVLEFDVSNGAALELDVAGNASLAGSLVIDFLNGLALGTQDTLRFAALGGISGSFNAIQILGVGYAYTEQLMRDANGYAITINAVPEPASLALLAGMVGVAGVYRRRPISAQT